VREVAIRERDRVIVAGGGPVGSTVAYLLARENIPVIVIEAEPGLVIDYRASTIHPPTLDLLEECGAAQAMVDRGLVCPVWQYRDRNAGRIAEFDLSVLKNDTRYPYRLQCEQFKLVDWLYARLATIPGVEMLYGHRLTEVRASDDGIEAVVTTASGESRTIAGDVLIGCDGGRSAVRRAMDIAFEGYTYPEHFLVAGTVFDFKAAMPGICSVNYTADPVFWYLLLEIPDMWRIIMPVDPSVKDDEAVTAGYIQGCLQNILPRNAPYEIVVRAIYTVHQRAAGAYRKGRVFLAGDAAHVNNPLGGMGLNGGLHDAVSLTRKLSAVWHGRADERLLDAYEAERRPQAIEHINAMTARNKKLMEERNSAVREAALDELRAIGADPARTYDYLLETSMIGPLRRSGLIG
jgi:3-(3-hydroxy-phenyl)propionate hydroxylase